jgi:hypothetical protein
MMWERLEQPINLILQSAAANLGGAVPPAPDLVKLALEMMAMLRQQNAVLSSPDKLVQPILQALQRRPAFAGWRTYPPDVRVESPAEEHPNQDKAKEE